MAVQLIPVLFIALCIFVGALYRLLGRLAPKSSPSKGKLSEYACGEDVDTRRILVSLHKFFDYIVIFVVFDILSFILAVAFQAEQILLPTIYLLVTMLSLVFFLMHER